ncbi:gluconate 2-dehydrogenase subunit 3 family protein [Balneolaceae bacterium ANBcel3]|nr:gluconate 2-dehydrogenase subunit 3 family protein [Balneolaceae bacterium ANBcel3]
MSTGDVSRRDFLKLSAIWAGSAWIVGFTTASSSNHREPYRTLTDEEAAIIDALADQIIPPDEYPGGKDAGVTHFVDQQLGGYLKGFASEYKTCLPALNNDAESRFGKPFIHLDEREQYSYLSELESGQFDNTSWGPYRPSSFFNIVRHHCMMGFYGSPVHGGNKEYISYQMLGLSVVQEPKRPGAP